MPPRPHRSTPTSRRSLPSGVKPGSPARPADHPRTAAAGCADARCPKHRPRDERRATLPRPGPIHYRPRWPGWQRTRAGERAAERGPRRPVAGASRAATGGGLHRCAHPDLLLIILTARTREIDIAVGLDAGIDASLIKPFTVTVLLARLRARLRRRATTEQLDAVPVRVGDLVMDILARRCVPAGMQIPLRHKQFELFWPGNPGPRATDGLGLKRELFRLNLNPRRHDSCAAPSPVRGRGPESVPGSWECSGDHHPPRPRQSH